MAIQNVSSTDPTVTSNQSNQTLPNQTVTQDDFLKLLISQLQNQDPLQPMDNQQFAVQLATFNSLSQLIDIDNKLGSLQTAQGTNNQFNAASLFGKEVVTSGNTVNLQSGGATPVNYQLAGNATKVVVSIQDSGGGIVRQLDAGQQNAGTRTITWDGKDSSGNALPSGVYTFAINASDINGNAVSASGQVQGIVTGVTLTGSDPVLELGTLQVPFSSVTSVRAGN